MILNLSFKRKYLWTILLGITLLAAGLFYFFSLPPKDLPDTLDVMYLSSQSEPSPLFKMQAQQTLNIDTLISQNGSTNLQGGTEPSLANGQEPSLTVDESGLETFRFMNCPIHLSLTVSDENLDPSKLIATLSELSTYTPNMTLSLLPDSISDEAYIRFGEALSSQLKAASLDQIEIIWYPQDLSNLALYDSESFKSIGMVINSSKDVSSLSRLYEMFSDSATLYIRDNICHFYKDNLSKASQEINSVYYLLAVEYPKIDTIFSPYRNSPLFPTDEYYLDSSLQDYNTICAIYYQIATKPWITFYNENVSDESPYQPLTTYSELSGATEIILDPNSNMLSNLPWKTNPSATATYLTYKVDETMMQAQMYYPYLMNLDTTEHANGVSRLKASFYDSNNQLVKIQSVDFNINNPLTTTRSARIATSYDVSSKSTYAKEYIPILMYHSILDEVPEGDQNSCVEVSHFEAQIKGLLDAGYTPINFKILKDYMNKTGGLPEKPILITMDDGYLNNYTNAYPIYKKYQVQATLFVSPYYMQEANTDRHFGWNAAQEMEDSGLIDIQSHGYNHKPFPYLSLKDLRYQISHAYGLIEQHLGPRDLFIVACPEFRNTMYTRKLLSSLGIDFQITKLAKPGTVLTPSQLKRINVPNTMSPDDLIAAIEHVTM